MRALAILFTVLCTACASPQVRLTQAEGQIAKRILHIREMRAQTASLWPGFDAKEFDTPLLYYTDSVCYAVDPMPQFREEFTAQRVYRDRDIEIYKTALPDTLPFHMATEMNFGDSTAYNHRMPFLACSSPELTVRVVTDVVNDSIWLPMVLHEYAHGFQFRQPGLAAAFAREMISTPEGVLARLHTRGDWFGRAIEAENGALLEALGSTDAARRDSCIGRFLALRTVRKRQMAIEMGDSTVRAEEIYEAMEGMARYVEAQAGFQLGSYAATEAWLYDVRKSGYFFATGYNLMRLMDSCGIDKSQVITAELRPLETYLTISKNNR